MLQAQDTQNKRTRALPGLAALALAAILAIGAAVGGTQAYLISKTDAYVNTFVSGLPATGELTIEGTKTLEGRSLAEGEFSFALYETDADFEVAAGAEPLQTVANEANGAFAFAPIEYTQAGDYYYVVTEKIPSQDEPGFAKHVAYDKTQYRVTVKVTEAGGAYVVDSEIVAYDPAAAAASQLGSADAAEGSEDGGADGSQNSSSAINAATTDSDGQDAPYVGTEVEAIAFTNVFDSPDPTVVVNGAKSLEGRTMEAGEFSFELYEADDEFKVAENAEPLTVVNSEEGGFGFDALSFSEAGTYRYVIREAAGALGGVTYDKAAYRLQVEVAAHDATGVLSAEAAMWTQDANGNWAEVAKPQPNDQGVLDKPDGEPYVAADPANGNCAVAFVTFSNSYEASPVSHEFSGDVDLEGRDMEEGEFLFTIEPQNGAPAPSSLNDSNAADGTFGFGAIEFTEPGTYEYLVKQDVSAALDGVTYDTAVHRVIVTVTDDGEGSLVKEVVVLRDGVEVTDGTGVKYVNAYEEPDDGEDPVTPPDPGTDPDLPDPDDPDDGGSIIPGGSSQGGTDLEQTGDDARLLAFASAAMAIAAVLFAAVAFVQLRRRS